MCVGTFPFSWLRDGKKVSDGVVINEDEDRQLCDIYITIIRINA
jgi:hypothetical protein